MTVAALLLLTRRSSRTHYSGIALLGLSVGLIVAGARGPASGPLTDLARTVSRCAATGEIVERAGGLGTLARIDALRCDGASEIRGAGMVVLDEEAEPGSGFEANGHLVPLGEGGFADARRRLGAEAAFDPSDIDLDLPHRPLMRAAVSVREGMRDAVAELGPDNGALLRGLTIGDTGGFDEATSERFRRAGLSHLVAVSGSNVAIVLGVFVLVAKPLGLYLRLALAAGGLLLYVLIVGPEPSVVRAGAMGAIGLLALAVGSRSAPLNALAIALVVVLAYRPALVHSVGLHMSAAATAGIVLWAPRMAERLHAWPRTVALAAGVTLAAQIAVAPIIIGVFEQLSLTGPIANLLAAPAVGPATVLGLAAGLAAALSPSAGSLIARGAEPFAWWIGEVARWLGGEWAAAVVPSWTGWTMLLPVAVAAVVSVRRTRTLKT
jgi:ComEC/Rec2-related protein